MMQSLIRQNPDGLTCAKICRLLQEGSLILGTYRNLRSMTSSVLELLVSKGYVVPVGCRPHTFAPAQREIENTGAISG